MYRWLNDLSQQFLDRDYLTEGQTVDQRVDIICQTAEKILDKPGFAVRMKENIQKGWYSLSTPIWSNFGSERGMPISCFGSTISDSMESIVSTWAEVSMMTKCGGGTSAYFGNIRPRGSLIRDSGETSGAVHFMQAFDTLVNVISQGKVRRGNFAAYLPIDHGDILEFLKIRSEGFPIQDLSYGVCITDDWMNQMINGDSEKRRVWARVLESRSNTGFPYLFFTDNVNNNKPECYKDLKITHSNLCVTGSQRVVSDRGLLTVAELYEQGGNLKLFDNTKTVNSSPMKLVEKNANVYKVTLDNGMSHEMTDYHKLVVRSDDQRKSYTKECKNLNIGDFVAIQTNKGIFGHKNMSDEAFLLGLYQADGTQYKENIMIDIWENDFDLETEIQEKFNKIHYKYSCNLVNSSNQYVDFVTDKKPAKFTNCTISFSTVEKKRLSSKTLKKCLNFTKGVVPNWIFECDEETCWQYIRGLLYADGTVFISKSKGNPIQISLSNINKEFLQQVQLIFANLGLQSSIRLLQEGGLRYLPDGKGGQKQYLCKDCYRLIVGNKNDALKIEENIQFLSRKNISLETKEYRDNTKKFYQISNIEYIGKQDVYCCTVDSDEHLWICNGLITHNCTEILEPDGEDESFVCDLASMNDLYYDEWKNTTAVEDLTYFLDAVMTEFIRKAKSIKFMERAVRFAERHRAIGIGQLGWHSLLQSKMIPWESMEAKLLNVEIAKHIKEQAYAASAKLAKEYGEPEVCKGTGRRNSVLLAIAPTKSSAFILGQVSESIQPDVSNFYIKDLAKGKFSVKNPYLISLLEEKGKNTKKIWTSILEKAGSVQHLDFLTEKEKAVFKTFAEISPKEIIIQAAQRQKYIDQGQSLNLMIHPNVPTKDVNALIIEAWKMGIKTLYYQFSVNSAQEFSRSILECRSCEA